MILNKHTEFCIYFFKFKQSFIIDTSYCFFCKNNNNNLSVSEGFGEKNMEIKCWWSCFQRKSTNKRYCFNKSYCFIYIGRWKIKLNNTWKKLIARHVTEMFQWNIPFVSNTWNYTWLISFKYWTPGKDPWKIELQWCTCISKNCSR